MEIQIEKTPAAPQVSEDIIKTENELVNDYDIDAYLTKRKEFITKLGSKMVEGKDYHVIQGKKSLAKGGAEKIASIFGWTASFKRDGEVTEVFKDIAGVISFVCSLNKHGGFVGEGRGAGTLARNNQDPNKTIKMAQKSAFIDAVLRSSGLSDLYSQDLEDMPEMRQKVKEPDINQIVPGHPPVNVFQTILDGIKNSKTEKELDGWRDNLKFHKKQMTIKQYTELRQAGVEKRHELDPIVIDQEELL